MTTTVLLVDDQPLIRFGFRLILTSQDDLDVVGEAADGAEAVRQAESLHPNVVVMDVRMPILDGVEATRQIVAAVPSSRVLILTTFDLDEYAFTSLRVGASGFLLKDVPPEELLAGIRAVAKGNAVVAPSVTRRLLDAYAHRLPMPAGAVPRARHPGLDRLTHRENEVLAAVARGLSNAEIATVLVLSEATVKTHISRILTKLELRDRVQAVILAYAAGIVSP